MKLPRQRKTCSKFKSHFVIILHLKVQFDRYGKLRLKGNDLHQLFTAFGLFMPKGKLAGEAG